MAGTINAGTIKMGFQMDVDQSSFQKIQKALKEVSRVSANDLVSSGLAKNIGEAEDKINTASKAAAALETALKSAFNANLGTTNVTKFNQELKNSNTSLGQLYKEMSQVGVTGQNVFRNMITEVTSLKTNMTKTTTIFSKMADTMTKTISWGISSAAFNAFSGSVQQAYNYVVNLDKSLNDIRIVTKQSAGEMDLFAQKANKAAQELGVSTQQYVKGSLTFYQQGLQGDEVQARADVSAKLTNVTGQSMDTSSEQVTAIANSFRLTADEIEPAMDKIAAAAANSASSFSEVSTAMQKVASTAATTGVEVGSLTSMLSTVIATTREAPESVGTAFKTIFARIGDLKISGVDEFGTTLGDVSGKLKQMGIDVLDSNGELKRMDDIIMDLGTHWEQWSTTQQQAAAVAIAGKRQYTQLEALLNNWDKYKDMLNTVSDSQGELQAQQDIYLDSAPARIKKMQAAWEGVYQSMLDANTVKTFAGIFEGIAVAVKNIIDTLGGGEAVFGLLSGLLIQFKSSNIADQVQKIGQNFMSWKGAKEQISALSMTLLELKSIDNPDAGTQKIINNLEKMHQYANLMSEDETELFDTLQEQTKAHTNNLTILEEEKRIAEGLLRDFQQSDSEGTIINTSNTDATINNLKNIDEILKEVTNEKRLNQVEIRFQAIGAEDVKVGMNELLSRAGTVSERIADMLQMPSSQQARDTLMALSGDFEQLVEKLTTTGDVSEEEFREMAGALSNINTEVQNVANTMRGDIANTINLVSGQSEQAISKETNYLNELDMKMQQINETLKQRQTLQQTINAIGAGISSASVVGNLATALGKGEGVSLQSISSLAMTFGTLAKQINTVSKAYSEMREAQKVHANLQATYQEDVNKAIDEYIKKEQLSEKYDNANLKKEKNTKLYRRALKGLDDTQKEYIQGLINIQKKGDKANQTEKESLQNAKQNKRIRNILRLAQMKETAETEVNTLAQQKNAAARGMAIDATGKEVAIKEVEAVSEGVSTASTIAHTLAVEALHAALTFGLSAIIPVIIGLFQGMSAAEQAATEATKEHLEEFNEESSAFKDRQKSLEDYQKEAEELQKEINSLTITEEERSEKKADLIELEKQMTEEFGAQAENIIILGDSLDTTTKKFNNFSKAQQRAYLREHKQDLLDLTGEADKLKTLDVSGAILSGDKLWLSDLGNNASQYLSDYSSHRIDYTEKSQSIRQIDNMTFRGDSLSEQLKSAQGFLNEQLDGAKSDKEREAIKQKYKYVVEYIDKLKEFLDTNKDTLYAAGEAFVQADNTMEDAWEKYQEADEEYSKAKIEGDIDAIEKASEKRKKAFDTVYNNAMAASEQNKQAALYYLESTQSAMLNTRKADKLTERINRDMFKGVTDNIFNKSDDQLAKILGLKGLNGEDGKRKSIEELIVPLLRASNLTTEELIAEIENGGNTPLDQIVREMANYLGADVESTVLALSQKYADKFVLVAQSEEELYETLQGYNKKGYDDTKLKDLAHNLVDTNQQDLLKYIGEILEEGFTGNSEKLIAEATKRKEQAMKDQAEAAQALKDEEERIAKLVEDWGFKSTEKNPFKGYIRDVEDLLKLLDSLAGRIDKLQSIFNNAYENNGEISADEAAYLYNIDPSLWKDNKMKIQGGKVYIDPNDVNSAVTISTQEATKILKNSGSLSGQVELAKDERVTSAYNLISSNEEKSFAAWRPNQLIYRYNPSTGQVEQVKLKKGEKYTGIESKATQYINSSKTSDADKEAFKKVIELEYAAEQQIANDVVGFAEALGSGGPLQYTGDKNKKTPKSSINEKYVDPYDDLIKLLETSQKNAKSKLDSLNSDFQSALTDFDFKTAETVKDSIISQTEDYKKLLEDNTKEMQGYQQGYLQTLLGYGISQSDIEKFGAETAIKNRIEYLNEQVSNAEAIQEKTQTDVNNIATWKQEINALQGASKGYDNVTQKIIENDSELKKIGNTIELNAQSFEKLSDAAGQFADSLYKFKKTAGDKAFDKLIEDLGLAIGSQEELNYLTEEYQALTSKGMSLKDLRTQYGNVNLNARPVIEWDEESLEKNKDALRDWGQEGQLQPGDYSTVLGSWDTFGQRQGEPIDIAFTPILQNGEILNKDSLYGYFDSIIDDIVSQGLEVTPENIQKMDAEGRQIGETFIKGVYAGAGENAETIAETMHFAGKDGSLHGLTVLAALMGVSPEDIANGKVKVPDNFYDLQVDILDRGIEELVKSIQEHPEDAAKLQNELLQLSQKRAEAAAKAITQPFDEVIEELEEQKHDIDRKISDIEREADYLDEDDYTGKEENLNKQRENLEEQRKILIDELENRKQALEAAKGQGLDSEVYKNAKKAVEETTDAINENSDKIRDNIKAQKDLAIAQRDAYLDAYAKVQARYDEYLESSLEPLKEQKELLEDNIKKEEKEIKQKKKLMDARKKELQELLKQYQKQWEMEDKAKERAEKRDERSKKVAARDKQLMAASQGDLEAVSQVEDLNEEIEEMDKEMLEDMVQDIRDIIEQGIQDAIDAIDKEEELLEKGIEKQQEEVDKLQELIDAREKEIEQYKKTDAYQKAILDLLNNGFVYLKNGSQLSLDAMTQAIREWKHNVGNLTEDAKIEEENKSIYGARNLNLEKVKEGDKQKYTTTKYDKETGGIISETVDAAYDPNKFNRLDSVTGLPLDVRNYGSTKGIVTTKSTSPFSVTTATTKTTTVSSKTGKVLTPEEVNALNENQIGKKRAIFTSGKTVQDNVNAQLAAIKGKQAEVTQPAATAQQEQEKTEQTKATENIANNTQKTTEIAQQQLDSTKEIVQKVEGLDYERLFTTLDTIAQDTHQCYTQLAGTAVNVAKLVEGGAQQNINLEIGSMVNVEGDMLDAAAKTVSTAISSFDMMSEISKAFSRRGLVNSN